MTNGKETLRSQISMIIQKRIREGVYKPGERIVETRLCKELSVSQAPVREAVLELAMMGILEERPYSGTFVKDVRAEDISDTYSVRAFIEEYATKRACKYGTEESFRSIADAVKNMENCNSVEKYAEMDRDFHQSVLKASGSEALMRCWNSLHVTQWTYQSILNTSKSIEEITSEHKAIAEAITNRNDHTAGALMFLHIRAFAQEITEYMEKRDQSGL